MPPSPETMRCAYCGKEKPWTPDFPIRTFAECRECIDRQYEALRPGWVSNLFLVLLAPVVLIWWVAARLYLAIGTRLRKD